jgi:hypothetical protein
VQVALTVEGVWCNEPVSFVCVPRTIIVALISSPFSKSNRRKLPQSVGVP